MQLGLLCDAGEQNKIDSCAAVQDVMNKVGFTPKPSSKCGGGRDYPPVPFVDQYGENEVGRGYFVNDKKSVCDKKSHGSRAPLCYCKAKNSEENEQAMQNMHIGAIEDALQDEANKIDIEAIANGLTALQNMQNEIVYAMCLMAMVLVPICLLALFGMRKYCGSFGKGKYSKVASFAESETEMDNL